jgi:hypothetical protein
MLLPLPDGIILLLALLKEERDNEEYASQAKQQQAQTKGY